MSWSESYNNGSSPIVISGGGGGGGGLTGLWSDPATWGGSVPLSTDAVVISSGQTVYLDTAAVALSVDIQGSLLSLPTPTASISLTTGNINVGSAGVFKIGTVASPFPAAYTCTITLNGAEASRTTRTVGGTNLGFTNSGVGRSLQVQPGGVCNLIGTAPTVKRTKLNAHASASATSFTLADSTGWLAGDEIVIGTTDFFGVSTPERLTLAANASGTGITTTTGISASRWGLMQYVTDSGMSTTAGTLTSPPSGTPTTLDERAMVINLTRNIIVQGANDTAWSTSKFGAHCMFMGRTSDIKLDGVQFRRVGQAGAIGRYPIHWHMMSYNMPSGMNAPSDGTFLGAVVGSHYAKNCSISESGQRMIVIHGTHGVTLDANVGFDITGHAIFLEDGAEQDNTITNNVVMKIRAPTTANRLLIHDQAAANISTDFHGVGITGFNGTAGMWVTNPQNTIQNNWVNDGEGTGIWNAFALQCFGLSVNVAIVPTNKLFTSFVGNIAYGCKGVGVQTNRPQSDDAGNTVDGAPNTYQGSFFSNPVIGTQTFKNGAGGYSNRVLDAQYQSFVGADNAGMDVFGQAQNERSFATNFLTVGESLNNATSRATSSKRAAFATYHELLNFKNTLIVNYPWVDGTAPDSQSTKVGGGTFRMDDLYLQPIFTFSENTGNKLIQTPAPYRTKPPNIDGLPLTIGAGPQQRNWTLSGAIRDVNGLFVPAGNHWVYDDPFFTSGAASVTQVAPSGSNGVHTTSKFFGVGNFNHTDRVSLSNNFVLPLTVTRQDTSGATLGTWVVEDGSLAPFLGWMRHFSPMQGGRYKLQFPGTIATTVAQFDVYGQDSTSDIFLVGVEFSGSVSTVKVFQRAVQFNSYTGVVPNSPGNTSISRVLTSTGSFANVVADTTGTIFWQDTANNLVWFQVKVGSLALAAEAAGNYGTSFSALIYKRVSIAVTA